MSISECARRFNRFREALADPRLTDDLPQMTDLIDTRSPQPSVEVSSMSIALRQLGLLKKLPGERDLNLP
jgi:hypothetical protein